jgi:hypothetical protein
MKSTIILFCLLVPVAVFGQNVFFDMSAPNGGPAFNYGGRVTFFTEITPKLHLGVVGRAHRIEYDDLLGAEGATRTFDEVSLGGGVKYFFYHDANSTDALYANPNLEVNSFEDDEGFDISVNIGYTRILTPLLRFNAELGTRRRTVLYQSLYGKNNRLQVYMGIGLGVILNYRGGLESKGGKYR